ncbi:MAG: hypothetical protein P8P76_06690 [Alphaproteobacteria bacterium]|nr:hypothetical protein [Alphaproteobacteria bacterium]
MRKYLIIALAILVGYLVLLGLSWLGGKTARGEIVLRYRYIVAAFVAVIVMVCGLSMLEIGAGETDMRYQPPQNQNGVIVLGQFVPKTQTPNT